MWARCPEAERGSWRRPAVWPGPGRRGRWAHARGNPCPGGAGRDNRTWNEIVFRGKSYGLLLVSTEGRAGIGDSRLERHRAPSFPCALRAECRCGTLRGRSVQGPGQGLRMTGGRPGAALGCAPRASRHVRAPTRQVWPLDPKPNAGSPAFPSEVLAWKSGSQGAGGLDPVLPGAEF